MDEQLLTAWSSFARKTTAEFVLDVAHDRVRPTTFYTLHSLYRLLMDARDFGLIEQEERESIMIRIEEDILRGKE